MGTSITQRSRSSLFLADLEKVIHQRQLLQPGERVVAGISGGTDSTVLLHSLHRLAGENQWQIEVAHFNHRLRGEESDADEQFVRAEATALNLQFWVAGDDVAAAAHVSGESIEMAARRLRHEFLARKAAERGAKIALGHHADDQVELFLMRLLRGASIQGLGGMEWSSPSPVRPDVSLIRPFLGFSKLLLQSFARENGLVSRHDRSNDDRKFSRNRVRLELLPHLRDGYQPALSEVLLRTMDQLREASHLIVGQVRELSASGVPFQSWPVAAQREHLQQQLIDTGISPSFELIEGLRQKAEPIATKAGQRIVSTDTGEIRILPPAVPKFAGTELPLRIGSDAGQEAEFDGVVLSWRRVETPFPGTPVATVPGESGRECFDADAVGRAVLIRHWRKGDRFQPIGLPKAVKLQDLFTNAKIPREDRHRLLVAVAEQGDIFWVEGLRIGEKHKISASSRSWLEWVWQRHGSF